MARSERWAFAAAGVVVGAMLLNPVAAHVNDSFRHLWGQHVKPKADNRYVNHSESPWAVIRSGGSVFVEEGVQSVTKTDTGEYDVVFRRRVTGCAATVTSENSNLVAGVSLNNFTVTVDLVNTMNNHVDSQFNLIMRCE
jgi:hypothetical protein